jgi:hypothetical protein
MAPLTAMAARIALVLFPRPAMSRSRQLADAATTRNTYGLREGSLFAPCTLIWVASIATVPQMPS